ncbi:hypothetical protein BMS3Abin09_00485 [bacterium BMS3Abin09]|nr:hypothetical protein BMS3Abin09_00485 [bacterium BMS3Abin09]
MQYLPAITAVFFFYHKGMINIVEHLNIIWTVAERGCNHLHTLCCVQLLQYPDRPALIAVAHDMKIFSLSIIKPHRVDPLLQFIDGCVISGKSKYLIKLPFLGQFRVRLL